MTVAEIRELTSAYREAIEAIVAQAPPLSPAQSARLAALLRREEKA